MKIIRREPITRGPAQHIDGCPIAVREYEGKPYANVDFDCLACKFVEKVETDYYAPGNEESIIAIHCPESVDSDHPDLWGWGDKLPE